MATTRHLSTLLFALFAFGSVAALPAQELTKDKFIADFNKGIELADDKLMDRAVKNGARHAVNYYESLWFEVLRHVKGAEAKCDALMASWKRNFGNTDTLDKAQRWADGASGVWDDMQKVRANSAKLWTEYGAVSKDLNKPDYRRVFDAYQQLAKAAESLGHYFEAGELWQLASVVGNKMPGKTLEEREEVVFVIEQSLAAFGNWGFTFDDHYIRNSEFVKSERVNIEEAKKKQDKRQAEGYDANAKGIDALAMPNVPAAKHALKFEVVKDWQTELDYGPKNGPTPPFWWMASVEKAKGNKSQLGWFRRVPLYMHRPSTSKFTMSWSPDAEGEAIDVSNKPKVSTFWLDEQKQVPYAMFFWIGTDRQFVNEAECNLAANVDLANVYYRSAASWEAVVDKDTLMLYDDSANGTPGDADPFAGEFKSPFLGDATGEGTKVPLLDSMRIGKGPRMPFSQFVQLSNGWHHIEVGAGATDVAVRPLNPEYVKIGKIKMEWAGPKTAAPVQLVVRGRGDYQSAYFDVASGKEIDVPAGEYSVVFGRIVGGKAPRLKTAALYPGPETKSFVVTAGATHVLKMGAPFVLEFKREGDQNTTIDATTLHLTEQTGCIITELNGGSLACNVMAGKDDSGKGTKDVGEFLPFTDPELVNKAASHYKNLGLMAACFPMPKGYSSGAMAVTCKLPADGMKVGLVAKKHVMFGKIDTVWK